MTHFNVLIQRKHRKEKTNKQQTSFLKETVENADLHKAIPHEKINRCLTDIN